MAWHFHFPSLEYFRYVHRDMAFPSGGRTDLGPAMPKSLHLLTTMQTKWRSRETTITELCRD